MTGARLNLSHTTLPECASLLEDEFWPAARQAGVEASLIVDLQGPELRVGRLEEPVPLREGSSALLGAGGIPVPRSVVEAARPGDQISLDDSAPPAHGGGGRPRPPDLPGGAGRTAQEPQEPGPAGPGGGLPHR